MPRRPIEATFYAAVLSVSTQNSMLEKTFFPRTTSMKHANQTYSNSSVASLSAARAEEGGPTTRTLYSGSPRATDVVVRVRTMRREFTYTMT